ncbi:unnamed protein product [Linum tenue]|uniref:Transcription elongation factor 1 homolog n=1 Tax=Linum tenue TaxID=586396 RepID=A0AAV0RR88_9ROSI|nr:unnamed protein product [Linum tenue]
MGKRKSSATKKLAAKKPKHAEKLEKVFSCPFCGFVDCVDPHLDKEVGIATLRCFRCDASYTTRMNRLTEPIDVFSEWIDECQLVNPDSTTSRRGDSPFRSSRPSKIPKHQLTELPHRRSCQVV